MEIQTLNKWADLLLDMGKRNNLINFRNTKMGTAEIVAPDLCTLFSQVGHTAEFEVYDPKLEDDDDDFDFIEDAIPENGQEESESTSEHQKYSKEQFRSVYERRLKKGQILIYNSACKPIQALKNISKKGRTAIDETGVNILYLAFGFINWREDDNSQYVMKAPILLVPVSIENDSALEPFRIKISDDEIIVNPTFSYKLKSEFNIDLPEFDDDEDVEAYFSKVERLLSKIKWTVSRECKLGIFSFLKINMYQDLKANAETISKSNNVRAMMGESDVVAVEGDYVDSNTPFTFDLMELHNVVDADSSQSEAIEMAKEGKSFVLQGPPGTGKSQTITNIVAEFLSDGKTVLFVSEKLAALSVVYEKLKKAGLDEFCLELHSHKANKKQVIDELCHTLRMPKSALSDRAQRELDIKRKAQHQLDTYAEELHKVRPVINKTLYRLYEEVSACRKAPDVEFAIRNIKCKDDEYCERAISALEHYAEYIPSIGYDYRQNAWYGFESPDVSYQSKMQLKSDLQSVLDLCISLQSLSSELNQKYGIVVVDFQTAECYRRFFDLVKDSIFICPAVLATGKIKEALNTAEKLQPLAKNILSKRAYLDELYDADIYKLDGSILHKMLTRQFSGAFSRLFSSEYKEIVKNLRLCNKMGKKPKYQTAVEDMDALRIYQEALAEYDRTATDTSLFGKGYRGIETDFSSLIAELQAIAEIDQLGIEYGGLAHLSVEEFASEQSYFASIDQNLTNVFTTSAGAEERLICQFNAEYCDLKNSTLHSLAEKCSNCLSEIDHVDNWWEFTKLLKRMQTLELKDFLNHMIDKKIDPEQLASAYKKAFYVQWVDAVLHESPIMLELARIPHDEAVKRFKEKDELNFDINKAKIRASVSAKRPGLDMVAQGSSIAILLREGEKKRKQKSVRQLLSEIGDLALTIKPCFLMSPLSVSTFLNADMQFDVVIFDEASQIFPQDAIGAIYRGKQLIVVGDSKQMPPSNFFNTSADMDDDSEDESITDFESILDLCSTSFPQRRLKWHYRSRYEQLISFSNKNFYDNDLITFPSAKGDARGVGVDYYYVDGTFDRQSKTNLKEAERVVELVFENIEQYPTRSLGVVAFSVAQQTLIEKLIAKRRQNDPSKEPFFKSDRAEPFFVKNLETVQGDERDTIIFSIAYAKDSQGRLLLNFGPVNRAGGERRLNVAVTRAKYNVQLVTSMHYSDIDLARTQSVGARLLREYLDYAENGMIALERSVNVSAFDQFDSEFEMEVCEFLRNNGYEVDTQIGCSSFKIDLALKHPHTSNYLLAIECDGAAYHSSKTARDRDRLRQSILENMGWKFYRIWSTDWFRNKRVEKERLLAAVKDAVDNVSKVHDEPKEADISFEEKAAVKHFEFPQYQEIRVSSIQSKYSYNVPKIVRAILEVEAPVSEEWMLKRLVYLYDREKVTSVVVSGFEQDMRSCRNLGIIRKNGFLYLQGKDIPMLRVPSGGSSRDIKYIAVEELALGLKELLKQNISAEKMGLFKLLVQHLGFSRMGDAILARLEEALKLLKDEIEINGEVISLK